MKIIFIFILLFGSKLEASTSLSFNYVSDETTPVGGFKILFSQDDVSIVGESKHEFFNLFFSDLDGKIIIPDSSSHYHFISSSMSSKDFDPITVSDALYILQYIVELRTLSSAQIRAADINADNQVTISDALMILQHIVGLRYIDFVDEETGEKLNEIDWSNQGNKSLNFIRRGDVNQSYEPVVSLSGLIEGETSIVIEENMNGCSSNCSFLYAYAPVDFDYVECGDGVTFGCDYNSSLKRFRLGFKSGYVPDYEVKVPWECPIKDDLGNCVRTYVSFPIIGMAGEDSEIDGGTHMLNINVSNLLDGWAERAQGIKGTGWRDRNGKSIAITGDGKTIVMGSDGYDNDGFTDNGNVRVFDWEESNWIQRGSGIDMTGKANNNRAGIEVSISDDGNTIAMGALNNPAGVRVFDWDGSAFLQRGNDIIIAEDQTLKCSALATATSITSGLCSLNSMSMSADGLTLALGMFWPPENPYIPIEGRVAVFKWNGDQWIPKGETIESESSIDGVGRSVSLNQNGKVLAIGSIAGYTKVFDWDGDNWIQKGEKIPFESETEREENKPTYTTLTADGLTLAIGSPTYILKGYPYLSYGNVRVFDWNGNDWIQKGSTMIGESESSFGKTLSISSSGDDLIVGAPFHASNSKGLARVLIWDGANWKQKEVICFHRQCSHTGSDFLGVTYGMNGTSVAISNDGQTIAMGEPDQRTTAYGTVHVYDWGQHRNYD